MQENHHSSDRKRLTVEQLLQLKRLENPAPEFWTGFEAELQQKQLQALVQPSRWRRLGAAFSSPRSALLAPLAAAAAVAVAITVVGVPYFTTGSDHLEIGSSGETGQLPGAVQMAALEPVETAPEAKEEEPTLRTDSFFVVDALVPDGGTGSVESFRTVAVPETLVGISDNSASYVVNPVTTGGTRRLGGVVLQF